MKIIALNKGEKNGIIKKEKGMHQNEYYGAFFDDFINLKGYLCFFSACQISKNRAYATKSHRFLFLLRFVHSFRLRFIHNGGYQQLRFVSGSSPAKTCTLVLCFYAG